MANGAKNRRDEQLLTDRQKRTILEMWERDCDEGGVALGFIQERFSHFELSNDAIFEIVTQERKKQRAAKRPATDWASRWASARSEGEVE